MNVDRVSIQSPRDIRLDKLKEYYLEKLVEDPQDGTDFDIDILKMIEELKGKYKNNQ